jgi:hypothetical protein
MVIVRRPMVLEVFQKRSPIERNMVLGEVAERERKAVIDADKRRHIFGQNHRQPLCDSAPSPILLRTGWRLHLDRLCVSVRHINAQTFETRNGCLRTGVVDSDIALECPLARSNQLPAFR